MSIAFVSGFIIFNFKIISSTTICIMYSILAVLFGHLAFPPSMIFFMAAKLLASAAVASIFSLDSGSKSSQHILYESGTALNTQKYLLNKLPSRNSSLLKDSYFYLNSEARNRNTLRLIFILTTVQSQLLVSMSIPANCISTSNGFLLVLFFFRIKFVPFLTTILPFLSCMKSQPIDITIILSLVVI